MKNLSRSLSFILAFALLFALIPVMGASASGNGLSFDEQLNQLRQELFSQDTFEPFSAPLPQVFIDASGVTHTPPKDVTLPLPADGSAGITPAQTWLPFTPNATHHFRNLGQTGTLIHQGSRVNVWTIGTTFNDQITSAMVTRFDQIVNAMEQSFAPFGGVTVDTPWPAQVAPIGDFRGDGRVNVLIHNHAGGGGFFNTADYFLDGGFDPIALFHVDAWNLDDLDMLYNIFAHEFQHLLFHLHFGVYLMAQGDPVTSQQFLWFNEALSELAGFLYAVPGSETIVIDRNWTAAINSYANPQDDRFGDFINFNNSLKGYGINGLYAKFMHRNFVSAGGVTRVTRAIFNYFGVAFPRSRTFLENRDRIMNTYGNMQTIVGNALNAARLTGSTNLTGTPAFNALYFLFMEAFAADGGSVVVGNRTSSPGRFINSDFSAHRLWGIRPSLGTNNPVFSNSTGGGWNLSAQHSSFGLAPLPVLSPGGRIALNGFDGHPGPATHEALHRLTGGTLANPMLNISLNDANSNTRYYVVVPNDPPGSVSSSTNRTFGHQGAMVHQISSNGTFNLIDTGGRATYLFVSTLNRNVQNVQVNYNWTTNDVDFTGVTANGSSATATTTQLTLRFNANPGALTSANVSISGNADVRVGAVSGTGNTRTVGISGTWANGTSVSVSVSSPNVNITGNPRSVTLHRRHEAPSFPSRPEQLAVFAGQTVTFMVGIGGYPESTVRWVFSDDGGNTWDYVTTTTHPDAEGMTSTELTIPNFTAEFGKQQFRAVATSDGGTTQSDPVSAIVMPKGDRPAWPRVTATAIGTRNVSYKVEQFGTGANANKRTQVLDNLLVPYGPRLDPMPANFIPLRDTYNEFSAATIGGYRFRSFGVYVEFPDITPGSTLSFDVRNAGDTAPRASGVFNPATDELHSLVRDLGDTNIFPTPPRGTYLYTETGDSSLALHIDVTMFQTVARTGGTPAQRIPLILSVWYGDGPRPDNPDHILEIEFTRPDYGDANGNGIIGIGGGGVLGGGDDRAVIIALFRGQDVGVRDAADANANGTIGIGGGGVLGGGDDRAVVIARFRGQDAGGPSRPVAVWPASLVLSN